MGKSLGKRPLEWRNTRMKNNIKGASGIFGLELVCLRKCGWHHEPEPKQLTKRIVVYLRAGTVEARRHARATTTKKPRPRASEAPNEQSGHSRRQPRVAAALPRAVWTLLELNTGLADREDRPRSASCSKASFEIKLCLTQVDRWRHSVSDVVEYVTTEKVTRIYFQHTSCIHTPMG
jgi:hypothetical protein